jgi:NADPH2:quinone reductase
VIRYDEVDFAEEVLERTGGRGVDLAIDGVGRTTFAATVRATRVRGHVIFFGQSSGAPDPIQPRRLLGSRTLTTASLFDYARTREELADLSKPVLAAAARAHALLEGRLTMGKLLLSP